MSGGAGRTGLRAVFLVVGLTQGGAETQLVRVAHGLRTRGWDVSVVSMQPPMGLADELTRLGVPLDCLGLRGAASAGMAAVRLLRLLRDRRPDVVITFMFHANVTGRVFARLAGVPAVVSSVRTDNFGGAVRYRAVACTDRLAQVTTTNSAHVAADLVRRGIVAPERMRVIPNGIDADTSGPGEEERRALRAALDVPEGEFAWLAVGHLAVRKDYPTLLRAVARIATDAPAWHVRIVGTGSLEGPLRSLAAELGVLDRVRFLGFRGDAGRLAHAADGFVMSSSMEGTPNALMEALLAATPAVGTSIGGIPELIRDGVCGYLVPPADPDALAAAMLRMMELPAAERRRMGEEGRARVVARHGLSHVVDQWEAVIMEATAARRPGRG